MSGGGKSEISKSIGPIMLKGPVFVTDFNREIERVEKILHMDFSNIYRRSLPGDRAKRSILSTERSLGSVIKLMTPSPEYKFEHNAWLGTISPTVRQLLINHCHARRSRTIRWREGAALQKGNADGFEVPREWQVDLRFGRSCGFWSSG